MTTVLFFALSLVAVFVNRNLVFEHRSSANQYRATQAFEAAEAGAQWALAQINSPQRLGSDCLPSVNATDPSFQARYFTVTPQGASAPQFAPKQWLQAGVPKPLEAVCVARPAGWDCSCPLSGQAVLNPVTGSEPAPAFKVQFVASHEPGMVSVAATGCTSLGDACGRPAAARTIDATAHVKTTWGMLPALRTPPAATLTVRSHVAVGSAMLSVHNVDPRSGLAIHAGTHVDAEQALLHSPAGAAWGHAVAADDSRLANLSSEQFFVTHFGLSTADWKRQPRVQNVQCPVDCLGTLTRAVAAADGAALISVTGDLLLDGPAVLGSAHQPVVLVVSGKVHLRGAVKLHGVLYGQALRWDDTPTPGAELNGAALSESSYEGNGTPVLRYDHALLKALSQQPAAWARVRGSWQDF